MEEVLRDLNEENVDLSLEKEEVSVLNKEDMKAPKVKSVTVESPPKERSFTFPCPICKTPIVDYVSIGFPERFVECPECRALCHVTLEWE